MKPFSLFLIPLLSLTSLFANENKVVESTIKQVTVYQVGAQVVRTSQVKLDRGVTELHFKGLPEGINPESIQASAEQEVTIVSVTHSIDYLNRQIADDNIMKLEARREVILDSINILKNIQKVLSQERELIVSNKSIGGEEGVKAADLEKMASFFRSRLTEIESKSYEVTLKHRRLQRTLVSIAQQIIELNAQVDKPTSLVKVKVSANSPTSSKFELRYFIPNAGWNALYDIRIDDIDSPMGLFYKAQVTQNTGEDWKDVLLTLSTGNPSISNYKPELSPYILTFDNYYTQRPIAQAGVQQSGRVSGRVIADDGLPIPGVSVMVKGTTIGAVTDLNGNYSIDVPSQNNTLTFSFVGYKTQEFIASSPVRNVKMKPDELMLEEVVVMGYTSGVRIRGASRPEPVRKMEIPLAIERSQVATEFKIEMPYSIPSDNKSYDVSILEYRVPASYKYAAVPKLSTDAYLMASIPDWHMYDLLNGDVNLFFKGIYQGKTFLDLSTIEDTLTLSVGRDRDIQIKRESKKEFAKRSLVGSNRREQRVWEITVKNNKHFPVVVEIEDQYPISRLSDIRVEQVDAPGSKVDESTGKVKWNLNLAAGETRTLTLRYTVRYPQSRRLLVE